MSPRVKFALGLGGVVAVAGGAAWAISSLTDDRKKIGKGGPGRLFCPREGGRVPAPSHLLERGDFVVVQLRSADGAFSEPTWATILDASGDDLVAVISGEQVEEGVRPIATDKHGFRLGHQLVLERDCIWEVFHPTDSLGQILCGPQIDELAKFTGEAFMPVRGGLTVEAGDGARVIVADKASFGNTWWEPLWTRIVNVSATGQILTAIVDEDPKQGERHGLVRGSVLRFNRDCVIGVS
jgi:hypothetical protein